MGTPPAVAARSALADGAGGLGLMASFDFSVELGVPRAQAFAFYRDALPSLVANLPNVSSIEVLERREVPEGFSLKNLWHGGGEIPSSVRKFLSPELLSWEDYALWNTQAFTCAWRQEVPAFREAVKSSGLTRYEEPAPGRTRLRMVGTIEVDARKVKGVPRLLAAPVGPLVEAFLMTQIRPNAAAVAAAVEKHLLSSAGP
jgi:hypothetical protein